MGEHHVSQATLTVTGVWIAVAALKAGAWAVVLLAPQAWMLAMMLAASAVIGSVIAVALHARRYVNRVCGLVSATSGLRDPVEHTRHLRAVNGTEGAAQGR